MLQSGISIGNDGSDCQQKQKRKVPADILLSSSNADPYYSLSPSLNGKARNYSL